MSKQDSGR